MPQADHAEFHAPPPPIPQGETTSLQETIARVQELLAAEREAAKADCESYRQLWAADHDRRAMVRNRMALADRRIRELRRELDQLMDVEMHLLVAAIPLV